MAKPPAATVHVPLPGRAYDIHIGAGLLAQAGGWIAPRAAGHQVAIVTEERVAAQHLSTLRASLAEAGLRAAEIVLPPGEPSKSWDMLQHLCDGLLDARLERGGLVIAFGGGVIGDLAGFAAAILRRGVGLVQIPTTLLAQVDSAVGGKTGINTRHGKNLIGAFHQPILVLSDTALLETLAPRDLLAGYAEVVKYGLLGDAEFFAWLERHGPALAQGDPAAQLQAVRRSCEMKAEIVLRDETEAGDRALLNLGHTFGHALEAATGYSDRLLHGEAVAIGCQLAVDLSAQLGLCPQEVPTRLAAHLSAMGMRRTLADVPGPLPDAEGLIALMAQDKKVQAGQLTFVLLRDIGAAFVTRDVPADALHALLSDALADRTAAAHA
ncbi:MAG: 3-dehydroquinate synthase [Pseudomonadota bacterium]